MLVHTGEEDGGEDRAQEAEGGRREGGEGRCSWGGADHGAHTHLGESPFVHLMVFL